MLFISLNSSGQVSNLFPCVDFSDEIREVKVYNENLEQIFQSNFKNDYIVRFIAKPPIEPEYAFQISERDSSVFEIAAITLNRNLWNTNRVDSLRTQRRIIDDKLVTAIDSLFNSLTGTMSVQDAYGFGEGGITYIFMYNFEGCLRCSETWSPENNSLLDDVINVCDSLMLYAQGEVGDLSDLHESINIICNRLD